MENLKKLINLANKASDSYYNKGREIMSNKEYDELIDLISSEEKLQGLFYPDSPTRKVGSDVEKDISGYWPAIKHEIPALSLDKTKDITEFVDAFCEYDMLTNSKYSDYVVIMPKLDGSTVVATYIGGVLHTLATRGNGLTGSDITKNARYLSGLPLTIPETEKIIVRGEVVMSKDDFDAVNAALPADVEPFKNARNLATASLQLTDEEELAKRPLTFIAFNIMYKESGLSGDLETFESRLDYIESLGINTVDYDVLHVSDLKGGVMHYSKEAEHYRYPVDGLVVASNDAYGTDELPSTSHNPHIMRGYAFKWADTEATTKLKDISWSLGQSGVLSPVAVFDKVFLEGTYVSKASVHNASCIEDLDLRIGDTIAVYKANKIIPQIARNLSKAGHTDEFHIDILCPECGSKASIEESASGTKVARCVNPNCYGKLTMAISRYCSRDGANIKGLSTETISKLVRNGALKEIADLYKLTDKKSLVQDIEGIGLLAYHDFITAIELSRDIQFSNLIFGLGIPGVGKTQAEQIYEAVKSVKNDKDILYTFLWMLDEGYDFSTIKGFGKKVNASIYSVFNGDVLFDCIADEYRTPIGRLLHEVVVID